MFARWFKATAAKKQERPYIKICGQCNGKGQMSYFNQFQKKVYGPCDKCSNGNGPYALGICLKCRCQDHSAPYIYIAANEVKHYRNALGAADLRELVVTQKVLGSGGTAVLLLCDGCGARYICQDGAGTRRKISGTEEMNADDKEFNRHIASTMVAHGILKELTTTEDGVVIIEHNQPHVVAATTAPARPGSAVPAGRSPVAPFGAVRSGGRPRPMSAPAYGAARPPQPPPEPQEPLFQHVGPEGVVLAPAAVEAPPPVLAPPPQADMVQEEEQTPSAVNPAVSRLRPQANANTPVSPISVV